METNGKWTKARTLAGLAAIGTVGSIGQYTIQNSKLPDWLSSVLGWLGTTTEKITSAFFATTLPLWLVIVIGFALAFVAWLIVSQHVLNHENLEAKFREVSAELGNAFSTLKLLREEKEWLALRHKESSDALSATREDRNKALEEVTLLKSINAELKHDFKELKTKLSETKLTPTQSKSTIVPATAFVDLTHAAKEIFALLEKVTHSDKALTIREIAEELNFTLELIERQLQILKQRGLISVADISGKRHYMASLAGVQLARLSKVI